MLQPHVVNRGSGVLTDQALCTCSRCTPHLNTSISPTHHRGLQQADCSPELYRITGKTFQTRAQDTCEERAGGSVRGEVRGGGVMWNEVRWGGVMWGEVRWGGVMWGDVGWGVWSMQGIKSTDADTTDAVHCYSIVKLQNINHLQLIHNITLYCTITEHIADRYYLHTHTHTSMQINSTDTTLLHVTLHYHLLLHSDLMWWHYIT